MKTETSPRAAGRLPAGLRRLLAATFVILLALLSAGETYAQQNVAVRPMRVVADVPQNRVAQAVIQIENRSRLRTEGVTVEVVELTQRPDGALVVYDDAAAAEGTLPRPAQSSRDWIEIPGERFEIEPEGVLELPVTLRVPPGVAGTHVSAVRITTDAPPPELRETDQPTTVLQMRFGFLVPFITEIAGRPVRRDVALDAVSMAYHEGGEDAVGNVSEPTTRVTATIGNDGQSYSTVVGAVRVERRVGDNWRLVTRAAIPEKRILPGITLELASDLMRRLPSGDYRLTGELTVDGRPAPRIVEEIVFEGDPEVDSVAYDTTMQLEPESIVMDVVPGATRTNTVAISNPSDQPITVSMSALTPEPLKGVAMGETMGSDLSAEAWTQIAPATFTLQPFGRRNVRVMTRVPREGVDHRHYYADLVLAGEYPDGQSAGQTRSTLMLLQATVPPVPQGVMERLSVAAAEEPSRYFVQARFVNTGNVHLEPQVEARLLDEGGRSVASDRLDGEAGLLLPLGIRDFGGDFDLSALPAGRYVLDARAEIGGTTVSRQVPVEIVLEGEARRLTVLDE